MGKLASDSDSESSTFLSDENEGRETFCKKVRNLIKRRALLLWSIGFWMLGVVVLSQGYGMSWITASYVVTQIVTTIGYGDISLSGYWMHYFISFYILVLLVLAGFLINSVVASFMDQQTERLQNRMAILQEKADRFAAMAQRHHVLSLTRDLLEEAHVTQIRSYFSQRFEERKTLLLAAFWFFLHVLFGTIFFTLLEPCSCSFGLTAIDGCTAENVCEVGAKKTYAESFYMSVVTLTTVGFGDYSPKSWWGRLVGIPWMLSGIVTTATFLAEMQNVLLHRGPSVEEQARTMNRSTFEKMDLNNNGSLSRHEFVSYMMVQEGMVDQDSVDALIKVFDAIDVDRNGTLTWSEVEGFRQSVDQPGQSSARGR
eukprot:CAMPEP_0206525906 /NCGR_PEP_ID=MMETSP0325_2-20121206/355_1 /ASSEMBLY_ACC=CAM_ASM_000347 /TAXON_ID=2866 /ORGANISM="Crypthecodinium cohnii, Strain Seligo" /LENGTH=369 /DNA_ID=CAMNT_0054020861 /DNA_START=238 /DNA_END=1344 /DNA_ORIENTATION=-